MTARLTSTRGQSLLEFALVLPLLMTMVLAIVEIGYALLDQHVVSKISREGSNLISRDITLKDAASAMKSMQIRPVDFDNRSRLILSVIKKGATTGTANYDKVIVYQRYVYGALAASSRLATRGPVTFGGAPDYAAPNADTNTNLQLATMPANLALTTGGMVYVTEVFTRHTLITPLTRFGITLPDTLYSIAYF